MIWFQKKEKAGGPDVDMFTPRSGSNPLHAYLDHAGFPWKLTRRELAAKFGIRKHSVYDSDVIEIVSDKPLVDHLVWPLAAQAFPQFSPDMPAAQFSSVAYVGDDARKNLRAVVAQLQPILGPGQPTSVSNCVGHRWYFDDGSVELYAFPPELQDRRADNRAHALDPRLKTACHVEIDTGFRQPASVQERAWIESFVPIARLPDQRTSSKESRTARTPQHELEFIRRAHQDFSEADGRIGCSADRSVLIFNAAELVIMPIADILHFEVTRLLPARGSGGSWLHVKCCCSYDREITKWLTICTGPGADDLTELGTAVAAAVGKRLEVLPYANDC